MDHLTSSSMDVFGRVHTIVAARGLLPQLRNGAAAVVIQSRGGKTKYGGITRDPLIHMRQKLAQQNRRKQAKIPLLSEERKQSRLTLPVNATSLSEYIHSLYNIVCVW